MARGSSAQLFSRSAPRTTIEAALDSFLDEIGDPAPNVEYWSRQEWRHIEAHADVDDIDHKRALRS